MSSAVRPFFSFKVTSAPALRRAISVSVFPRSAATIRAVTPSLSLPFTSGFAFRTRSTVSMSSPIAARTSGVVCLRPLDSNVAPAARRASMLVEFPCCTARRTAVLPSVASTFGSAPAFRRSVTQNEEL